MPVTFPGVPLSLSNDGWWLSEPSSRRRPASRMNPRRRNAVLALVVVIAVSELVLYGHRPGLGWVLFATCLFVVALSLGPNRARRGPVVLFILCALPAVEYLQTVSVLFLVVGTAVSVVWARIGGLDGRLILHLSQRLMFSLFWRAPYDLCRTMMGVGTTGLQPVLIEGFWRKWGLALIGAGVLALLLSEGNPLLSHHTGSLLDLIWAFDTLPLHLLLWITVAAIAWPFLAPLLPDRRKIGPVRPIGLIGINAGSVLRGLVVFNIIMAVQTGLDATYLIGGTDLPDGLTYATYARQGAYPLVLTALLAGAFALAARPFLREHKWLKPLLLVWLAQNILLTASAMIRLSLYIEAYGLTYLRFHAGIWMGMVAVGLALVVWQCHKARSNGWLLLRCAALGVGTVYALCFVNVASIIADYNTSHVITKKGHSAYVCQSLPRTAAAALHASGIPPAVYCFASQTPRMDGLMEWGFRKARVRRMLAAPNNTGALR